MVLISGFFLRFYFFLSETKRTKGQKTMSCSVSLQQSLLNTTTKTRFNEQILFHPIGGFPIIRAIGATPAMVDDVNQSPDGRSDLRKDVGVRRSPVAGQPSTSRKVPILVVGCIGCEMPSYMHASISWYSSASLATYYCFYLLQPLGHINTGIERERERVKGAWLYACMHVWNACNSAVQTVVNISSWAAGKQVAE
jgi:hypothetical protein